MTKITTSAAERNDPAQDARDAEFLALLAQIKPEDIAGVEAKMRAVIAACARAEADELEAVQA